MRLSVAQERGGPAREEHAQDQRGAPSPTIRASGRQERTRRRLAHEQREDEPDEDDQPHVRAHQADREEPERRARAHRSARRWKTHAIPYAQSPRPSIIQASLPIADGQYSSEGRKSTRIM